MSVWKASRGLGGKSFMLAALALAEAATLKTSVAVIGGSGAQAESVVRYTEELTSRETFPADLIGPGRAIGDAGYRAQAGLTKTRVRLANGGSVLALAASTRAARGPHPTRLRIDEADEMSEKIFDAAMGQTMARDGVAAQTVISSTHHYPDGMMTKVLERAEKGGWPVYEWCYRCTMRSKRNPDGWLAPEEVERKRGEVTAAMWGVEFDLQEPSAEGRAIDTDAVELAFDPDIGEGAGDAGKLYLFEDPIPGADYVTGTDWAKRSDWTVITTGRILRRDPLEIKVVAWERVGRAPWPYIIGRHNARIGMFGGIAIHDATGLGDVVEDFVDPGIADLAGGVVLGGQIRHAIFTAYIVAIEAERIRGPRIEYAYKEHKYATPDDLYRSGQQFHPPDSFVSGALMYHAARIGAGEAWLVYDD